MIDSLERAIEDVISRHTGRPSPIARRSGVAGGCINNAEVIELDDGRRYFVKSNPNPHPRLFECECEGLAALAAVGAIRVPQPVGTGNANLPPGAFPPFIVMEYIPRGSPGPCFQEELGRRLAQLHRQSSAPQFGFARDNYIGSTPQPNGWMDDWIAFWRERRLGFQFDLARRNGLADAELSRLGDKLLARLDEFLAEPNEPPCLLHGDLWGGNYLCDDRGEPVLIDPATYYGRREADLAMTQLFGGFTPAFYGAYQEVWPLAPASETRLEIYRLYHLLNHLNLFGASYLPQCLSTLRRLA